GTRARTAQGSALTYLPLAPDVIRELRASMRELQPELDDYVFTVEVEQFISQYERVRRRKDPKVPASEQALWRMVQRVCKRAGVQALSLISCATALRIVSSAN